MKKADCLSAYVPVIQTVFNHWIPTLGTSPGIVLFFICERTLRWGKEWEYIRHEHFVSGVPTGDTEVLYHAGTGLSLKTVKRAISNLRGADFIFMESTQHTVLNYMGNRYSVNRNKIMEYAGGYYE